MVGLHALFVLKWFYMFSIAILCVLLVLHLFYNGFKLDGWLAVWMAGWLAGLLARWLAGWLAGWLAAWLAG